MRLTSPWAMALGLPITILALPILSALVVPDENLFDPENATLRDSSRAAYVRYRALRLRDEFAARRLEDRAATGLTLRMPDPTVARHGAAIALRDRLAELSQAPALTSPSVPMTVVLYAEPSPNTRVSARPVEGVVLPRRAGDPCVVQRSTAVWPLDESSAGQTSELQQLWIENGVVRSPCLLLASLGPPATRLAASLDSIQWAVAYGDEWWRPAERDTACCFVRPTSTLESFVGEELQELEFLALFDDCVAAPPRGCGAALVGALSRMRLPDRQPFHTGDAVLLPPAPMYTRRLVAPIVGPDGRLVARGNGRPVRNLLSDIARTLGPERFARMWRTDLPWPEAYAAVAGESFDAFAARWLRVEPPRRIVRGAGMPPADWWWLVTIVAGLLGVTLWRVQRRQHA